MYNLHYNIDFCLLWLEMSQEEQRPNGPTLNIFSSLILLAIIPNTITALQQYYFSI